MGNRLLAYKRRGKQGRTEGLRTLRDIKIGAGEAVKSGEGGGHVRIVLRYHLVSILNNRHVGRKYGNRGNSQGIGEEREYTL